MFLEDNNIFKRIYVNLIMVSKRITNSLSINSYACNKLYNNIWLNLVQQLRLCCNRQSEEIVERRFK